MSVLFISGSPSAGSRIEAPTEGPLPRIDAVLEEAPVAAVA
ncbi:hypothetical protein [Microbispora siamensis]|uniref:FMN reductase n=1 Tax=Microbispora siamensis TaxID=564413 RepID=A0ABQ4GCW6_9ACTN|nr:hypothetical protein [Microbispora siamensis]GIH59268.1 hypothetical protein Msi02_00850 [Microbispora siamensis]